MAHIENAYTSKGLRRMLGRDLQWWLDWANTAYLSALILAALAALVVVATSWLIIQWQGEIQETKDAAFDLYKADAGRAVAEARLAAADANAGAAKANERAAGLENEAAQARLEQERLKAHFAWRTLSREQAKKLETVLAERPSRVTVEFPAGDLEAQYVAIQLLNIFESAGWETGHAQSLNANSILFGFRVNGPSEKEIALIKRAFEAADWSISDDTIPEFGAAITAGPDPRGAPRIFVGSKEPLDIGEVPLEEAR